MQFKHLFSQAIRNLWGAKLRAFLAALGVMVGTAAVVSLITLGNLATRKALSEFKSLGTELVAISLYAKQPSLMSTANNKLSLHSWLGLASKLKSVDKIAPYALLYGDIRYQGQRLNGTIIGADDDLKNILKIKLQAGHFISFLDTLEKFCVVGKEIQQQIENYSDKPVLGQQLWVGSEVYTIIGVAKSWQENAFFNSDVNKAVFIPIRGIALINKEANLSNAIALLKKDSDIDKTLIQIKQYIANAAPGYTSFIRSAKQLIKSMGAQAHILTLLLSLIGGISLLVGGIGIMNVMLVSVTERKSEIGIRMAIGANRYDILWLFLIESALLSLFGGILGVLLGLGASYIISFFAGWPFVFLMLPTAVGFLVSSLTGIFFGFYPAFQASSLSPIEALRA